MRVTARVRRGHEGAAPYPEHRVWAEWSHGTEKRSTGEELTYGEAETDGKGGWGGLYLLHGGRGHTGPSLLL